MVRTSDGENDLRQQIDNLSRQLIDQSTTAQSYQEQIFALQQQMRQIDQEKRLAEERVEDIKYGPN